MTRTAPLVPTRARLAIALQLLPLVSVFLVTAFYPRAGQAGLLIPLTQTAARASFDWAVRHDAAPRGRGPLGGSLVVRAPSDGFALRALAQGAFVIAVPAAWCGASLATSGTPTNG